MADRNLFPGLGRDIHLDHPVLLGEETDRLRNGFAGKNVAHS